LTPIGPRLTPTGPTAPLTHALLQDWHSFTFFDLWSHHSKFQKELLPQFLSLTCRNCRKISYQITYFDHIEAKQTKCKSLSSIWSGRKRNPSRASEVDPNPISLAQSPYNCPRKTLQNPSTLKSWIWSSSNMFILFFYGIVLLCGCPMRRAIRFKHFSLATVTVCCLWSTFPIWWSFLTLGHLKNTLGNEKPTSQPVSEFLKTKTSPLPCCESLCRHRLQHDWDQDSWSHMCVVAYLRTAIKEVPTTHPIISYANFPICNMEHVHNVQTYKPYGLHKQIR
jgi:phage FluMu protein Com